MKNYSIEGPVEGFADSEGNFGFNDAFEGGIPKPSNLVEHLCDLQKERDAVQHLEFFELLKKKDVMQIGNYLKAHRLPASDEYQMIVFLAMELEDESVAEKMICNYVHRCGLRSARAKQVLKDLRFVNALRELPNEKDYDLVGTEIPMHTRMYEGLMMLESYNL